MISFAARLRVPAHAETADRSRPFAFFHAALDVFITSSVAGSIANVMGALLTIGTLLLVPLVGRENVSGRDRVSEYRHNTSSSYATESRRRVGSFPTPVPRAS